jgi:hypothetical protein
MNRVIAVALSLFVGACTVTQKDKVSVAVWADDGSEQAYMVVKWEELTRTLVYKETERRDYRYQLFVQDPDGSDRRALFSTRSGHGAPSLYFMKSQGYLVYGKTIPTATEGLSAMQFQRLSLAGDEQAIMASTAAWQPCGAFDAIPSPDGEVIAVVERKPPPGAWAPPSPPPSATEACQGSDLTVTLFDASPLVEAGSWKWTVNGSVDYGWTSAGELFIEDEQHTWRVDSAAGPQPDSAPACLYPKTTSSAVSSAGVIIKPTDEPDDPIRVDGSGGSSFGACTGG